MIRRLAQFVPLALGLVAGLILGAGYAAWASRGSSGTYTLPSGNPVVTGTTITSTWANNTLSDISTALTDSLSRNGYGGMLAPLRLTNGSVSAPSLGFTSDTNTGLYRGGADDIRITAGGADTAAFSAAAVSIAAAQYTSVGTLTVATNGTIAPYSGSLNLNSSTTIALAGTSTTGYTTITGASAASYALQVNAHASASSAAKFTPTNAGIGVDAGGGATGTAIKGTAGSSSGKAGYFLGAASNASPVVDIDGSPGTADPALQVTASSLKPAAKFVPGASVSPTRGTINLDPSTNAPSAASDGDVWAVSSGPIMFKANSTTFAVARGSCVLGTSCASIAVKYSTNCVCADATSAAACKSAMTNGGASNATVTFTGTGTDTLHYICM